MVPGEGDEKVVPSRPEVRADEVANARQLTELADDGWEYVGPLNTGMVAFRRVATRPLAELAGEWRADDGTEIVIALQGDVYVSNYFKVSDPIAGFGFMAGDLCLDVVRPDGKGAYKGRGFYRSSNKGLVTPGDIVVNLDGDVLTMSPSSYKHFVRIPAKQ